MPSASWDRASGYVVSLAENPPLAPRAAKFVLGFLLISALASVGFFTKEQIGSLGNLSRWAFLLTFAGVGLRTNFKQLKSQGLRPFAVGAIGEIAIAAVTLGMVLVAARIFSF
ncbi:MAG TPA: putative sulfate exporter family transporter [Terriglobales bacterium]